MHNTLQLGAATLRQIGLGKPSGWFLFGYWYDPDRSYAINPDELSVSGFYGSILLSNIPHLLLSLIYILYNSYLTCMLAAREYGLYTERKRSIRVSQLPKAGQKSKHFLSIPIKYAVFGLSASALLHYLVSQAVFFANVEVVDDQGSATWWSLNQVGWSPLGLILLAVVSMIFAVAAWAQGLRKLEKCMPVAASCSAWISAACHPVDCKTPHHLAKIHWDVELDENGGPVIVDYDDEGQVIGHCAFTSGTIASPVKGKQYM